MSDKSSPLSIFFAIIIAGFIIAVAIVGVYLLKTVMPANSPEIDSETGERFSIKSISNEDHFLGNPNSEIHIIEYSDLECPYCKSLHSTLNRIIKEMGQDGKISWVYRHFPIDNHPNARYAAWVSECVAENQGNEAFWSFLEKTFEFQDSLSEEKINSIAYELGVTEDFLNSCKDSTRVKDAVESDYQDGLIIYKTDKSFGTPYLIFYKDGEVKTKLAGALTYASIKNILEALLAL